RYRRERSADIRQTAKKPSARSQVEAAGRGIAAERRSGRAGSGNRGRQREVRVVWIEIEQPEKAVVRAEIIVEVEGPSGEIANAVVVDGRNGIARVVAGGEGRQGDRRRR